MMLNSSQLLKKDHLKIIGLMSGTSCDGLDIALIEIETNKPVSEFKFITGQTIEYSARQRDGILKFIQSDSITLEAISQINFYLAKIWSEMIDTFLYQIRYKKNEIDLIGSHGQTLWHQPDAKLFIDSPITSTLQAGDPAVLAQLSGIPVIGDFRVADVALNGQGAPLIPYFDWIYFSPFKKNLLIVNIGGISNFTFIPSSGKLNEVLAFDCGPGNMLIDQAAQILFNKKFDLNGSLAAQGNFSDDLFEAIKKMDSFINKEPPKSTGREHYNRKFLNSVLNTTVRSQVSEKDVINTLTEYTAFSMHYNYLNFVAPMHKIDEVVLGGGGSSNKYLVKKISEYFKLTPVKFVHEYGLNEDFKEAIGFAILAHETLFGKCTNVPQVTNAKRPAILGKFCPV
jgi:anhydro-N-acetylmuramic acid kinase